MLLLPTPKRVQHFPRSACMLILLDLKGHEILYWHHCQVQTIGTSKMLAIACKVILNFILYFEHS